MTPDFKNEVDKILSQIDFDEVEDTLLDGHVRDEWTNKFAFRGFSSFTESLGSKSTSLMDRNYLTLTSEAKVEALTFFMSERIFRASDQVISDLQLQVLRHVAKYLVELIEDKYRQYTLNTYAARVSIYGAITSFVERRAFKIVKELMSRVRRGIDSYYISVDEFMDAHMFVATPSDKWTFEYTCRKLSDAYRVYISRRIRPGVKDQAISEMVAESGEEYLTVAAATSKLVDKINTDVPKPIVHTYHIDIVTLAYHKIIESYLYTKLN